MALDSQSHWMAECWGYALLCVELLPKSYVALMLVSVMCVSDCWLCATSFQLFHFTVMCMDMRTEPISSMYILNARLTYSPPLSHCNDFYFAMKLSLHICRKVNEFRQSVTFAMKRKNPNELRKMVKKNKIISNATNTWNRRGLYVRVNNIKRLLNWCIRSIKRLTNMFSKLTWLTHLCQVCLIIQSRKRGKNARKR